MKVSAVNSFYSNNYNKSRVKTNQIGFTALYSPKSYTPQELIEMLNHYMLSDMKEPETIAYFYDLQSKLGIDGIKRYVGEYGIPFVKSALNYTQIQPTTSKGLFKRIRQSIKPDTKEQTIQKIFNKNSKEYRPENVFYELFYHLNELKDSELASIFGKDKANEYIEKFKTLGFFDTPVFADAKCNDQLRKLSEYGKKQVKLNYAVLNLI